MDALAEPFDLCGLSLGALHALRYAGERADRVRRLVVCAGFARLPVHLRLLQRGMAAVAGLMPRRRVLNGIAASVPEPYRATAREEIDTVDVGAAMCEGASFRLRRPPPMPTLVLCGERDRFNLTLSRRLSEALPDARFAVVPAAGHVANLDNPDAFNELLREFLAY